MMHRWQEFFRKPFVWINLVLALLLNLAAWTLIFLNINSQEDLITLHYTLYFGIDRVGSWVEALLIPAVGFVLLVINYCFAFYFHSRAKVLRNFFLVLTGILNLLVFLAALLVVIANLPPQI